VSFTDITLTFRCPEVIRPQFEPWLNEKQRVSFTVYHSSGSQKLWLPHAIASGLVTGFSVRQLISEDHPHNVILVGALLD
jgi:hypothetical protein